MRIRTSALVGLVLAAMSLLAFAAPAGAKVRVVHKGHSIQAAIDAANPGDTILVRHGTYRQSLQIDKNRIRLKGQHAVLKPPATLPGTLCNRMDPRGTGICVVGQVIPPAGEGPPTIVKRVSRDRITGFTIRGFGAQGIFSLGANRLTVDHNRLERNGDYGVFSNFTTRTHLSHNVATRNRGEAGLYVGDQANSHTLVDHNRSVNNHGEGLLLRDATHGRVSHNRFSGNCAGLLVLADAPGPATNWVLTRNRVTHNNRACAGDPEEGSGPTSGIGIALAGAQHVRVSRNVVTFNRHRHPSDVSGGLVIISGNVATGTPPMDDAVSRNVLFHNSPFDIDWNGTGSVTFSHNSCGSSRPSGLC